MKARTILPSIILGSALVLSGCGAQAALTAADEVPALNTTLGKVDGYLAHHQYSAARRALYSMITGAESAQRNGTLSDAAANRIISAARALLAELPKPKPTVTPIPTPTPQKQPERKGPPKKHEDKHKKSDNQEGDQRLIAPTPTASSASTPTPTPDPSPTPTSTASPAVLTPPTP
ncbi:hypothetical protein [Nocardioides marmorisolisilvae]|uniref:Lipoprotein n=1 Tax=Nocardioides marmorisolisilvae TaxID=1542737 RepID=A0A3N0DS89_9ACTN|nr:hypothetical protein [Nocardioides marmorisolisilvae]RNL78494.1 hypothetical protein EFL95_05200 [Nocardioides marmorisolisilvae]